VAVEVAPKALVKCASCGMVLHAECALSFALHRLEWLCPMRCAW
jgi:hypothetical protein